MEKTPLPKLDADPDARLVRWGWIAWLVVTGVLALRYATIRGDAGALLFVASVQLAALWILWPLYRGARALWHWMHAAPYLAWNGSYYEFDGRQVRVLFDDGAILVVADDVYAVLDRHGRATAADRVRAIAGRDGLRRAPGRRELVFTERGLAAWLDRCSDARAVTFRLWMEQQVIAPYRRRIATS